MSLTKNEAISLRNAVVVAHGNDAQLVQTLHRIINREVKDEEHEVSKPLGHMKAFFEHLDHLRKGIIAAEWTEPTLNDLTQVVIAWRLTQLEEHLRLSAKCLDYFTDHLNEVGAR